MLELPETITIGKQMQQSLVNKTVRTVFPPTKPHKLTWFAGDPADYHARLVSARVIGGEGFGSNVQIAFDNGLQLSFSDGAFPRLYQSMAEIPADYQLCIAFEDGTALAVSVAMYGGIVLHERDYDNPYYVKSRLSISPLSEAFPAYFEETLAQSKQILSAKAFLATEQRFPGLGNGVLQDILLNAGIHPRRKIATLSKADQKALLAACVDTLREMTQQGGRDTEKDLFGNAGGYRTLLSKNTLPFGCPKCGGAFVKEAYLGGAVYYCPNCQPLV